MTPPELLSCYPVLAGTGASFDDWPLLQVPAGTVLFKEGQAAAGFPLLLAGAIRVVKAAPNGREILLYRVLPGETCVVSSTCLPGGRPYDARGIAETDARLVLLPRERFLTLLAHEGFRRFVFDLLHERLADMMALVEEVAFRRLDARLAEHLLGRGNPVRLTHQQLADELGSVREIVTRLLQGFRARGWVSLAREEIRVLDPVALRALSDPHHGR